MAIVQLKSTNPQFTYLIKKNPSSGMQIRSVRKGLAYGWYTDESVYNVYFKDADNEVSYKENEQEQFEYLNVSRYHTPLFPLNAINEFFSAPYKNRHEQDADGYENTFHINMIHVEWIRYIESFEKHMRDCRFERQMLSNKSYSLTIITDKSLYHLLHVVSVLCLFLAMSGHEYIDLNDEILDKYIQSIQVIDAPFYIRSLFARNFLTSKTNFWKYKKALESTDRYAIDFDFGGTAFQRRNYIGSCLKFDKSILDVGCGEGFYAIPFAKKIEGCYYAVDINQDSLATVERKANAKELDNISLYPSIERFLADYNGEQVDIIMTEVIEHMSKDEAKQFIQTICANIDFDQFIITTPNADFNPYYELQHMRHDDHKWEMGQEEFRQWFRDVVQEIKWEVEFIAIGDGVNSIRTTQGVILKKRGA
ncbi:class I SAM-dependent methyltransferase [Paenibacillus sp. BK720]|uniref:class I SAM-dependent methyltransferase n=1 Tax=Paenibacillus sp. BK720 TaxID=2587092 RepID=UPI0014246D9D|nr:class I SAM-dependent methyltransferase [Paenibacillus sp. BK720]NIK67820.1 2-polyprenyl-3-methyl-5-hydroxy-6-metoxy-1,4-benzoquinol methylase [Paenibacillus sp. BK720]